MAIARAMVTKPHIILADEPTGALDSKSSRYLLESMEKMNSELHATILMVTHDAFTASYASRVIFIKDGMIFHEIRKGQDLRQKKDEIIKAGFFCRDLPDAMRFADHFFRSPISEYRHMRVSASARVFFDLCVKKCSKQIVILRVCHIFGERCEKKYYRDNF